MKAIKEAAAMLGVLALIFIVCAISEDGTWNPNPGGDEL